MPSEPATGPSVKNPADKRIINPQIKKIMPHPTKVRFFTEIISTEGYKYTDSFPNMEEAVAFAMDFKDDKHYVSICIYMVEERNVLTIK